MKSSQQLSPLLRFKAKSELAEFSKPIEIPKRLEPLDLNAARRNAGLTDSYAFVYRMQGGQWTDGATPAIRALQESYLTDEQLMKRYFIEENDMDRMEKLKQLMKDKDDFVFGNEGIEKQALYTQIVPENSIFEKNENIDETEMHIMAFNEAIDAICDYMPNTAGALRRIRNYFIYKVKEKNRLYKSLEEATKELDQRCYQATYDVTQMQAEMAELNRYVFYLTAQLEKEKGISAYLRSANLKCVAEKEYISNMLESVYKQNFYLSADMKMKEREKEELNNRARRLQAGVNRYRDISDTAYEKISQNEKKLKQFENFIEEKNAELIKMKIYITELQEVREKQLYEIVDLQRYLDEGFSRDVRKAPENAPDPVKMAVEALMELSQKVRYDQLVEDFGLERENLVCARNLIVAIKDSDYIYDVVNAANGMCAEVMEYRTVGVQVSLQASYAYVIAPYILYYNSPYYKSKPKDESPVVMQQNFVPGEADGLAEQAYQSRITDLNKIIDRLKRDNMNLSQKCAYFRKENENLTKVLPPANTKVYQYENVVRSELREPSDYSSLESSGINDLANPSMLRSYQMAASEEDYYSAKKSTHLLDDFNASMEAFKDNVKTAYKTVAKSRKSIKRDKVYLFATLHFSEAYLNRRSINLAVASIVKVEFYPDVDVYALDVAESLLTNSPQNSVSTLPKADFNANSYIIDPRQASGRYAGAGRSDSQLHVASTQKIQQQVSDWPQESCSLALKVATSDIGASSYYLSTSKSVLTIDYNSGEPCFNVGERKQLSQLLVTRESAANLQANRSILQRFYRWLGGELLIANAYDRTDSTEYSALAYKKHASAVHLYSHHYYISDLMQFVDNTLYSATYADILDYINEIVRSLPQDLRYNAKINLNNVLFKHIDHQINKKNFAYFYDKYSELLRERAPDTRLADEQLIQQVQNFIDYASAVKSVYKQDYAKDDSAEDQDMELLDPRAPATSKQIANQNKIIQRQYKVLSEFAIDSREIAYMSDLLFGKYVRDLQQQIYKRKEKLTLQASRSQLYTTGVDTEIAPQKSIEQLKYQAKVEMCDFSINVDFLENDLLPFQSEALNLGYQIRYVDNFVDSELYKKVEAFVPPKEHKEQQTEESAVTTDKTMQTDTAIDDFMQDDAIIADMKNMLKGDVNNFNVVHIKGMDDGEQALVELCTEDIVEETKVTSTLLARKVRYNNLVQSSQVDSRARDLLSLDELNSPSRGPCYVENTTIEDGIRDQVLELQKDADRMRLVQERACATVQNPVRTAAPQISAAKSLHFQKGLEQSSTGLLQSSQMVPSIQQRNAFRYGQLASHKLDQTSVNAKYSIASSKLSIDQNEIMQRLKSIEASMPSYYDFLKLVKNAYGASTIETAGSVLQSSLEIHPRYGEFSRFSYKTIISPPNNDYFVIQHPVDKIYLKYCPADGDVNDATVFYPAALEGLEGIEQYYYQAGKAAEASVQTAAVQAICALQRNTRKHFKYDIDVATFQQIYSPSPELRKLRSLLPQSGATIKYVRLSALTFSTSGYLPSIFKMLEDVQTVRTQTVELGQRTYISLPIQNVSLKSLNWTLKLIKTLVADRMGQTQQMLATTQSDAASTFVTAASDARKVRFTVVPGNLQRREAESISSYFVTWAMQKYGVKTIVAYLAWNLVANLCYYQYDNAEVYLFARMFFEDLEPDYFLFYIELRRILDLRSRYENVVEMISTRTIPSIVATTLKNWEPKRQYSFVQNVFSILYSKQDDNQFTVPNVMEFQYFCQLILFGYGMFRRTAFQQAGLVFNHLAKEYGTGNLLGEAGFRYLCQVLIPQWSSNTVSEMFYAFSAGPSTTDLSQRRMAMANLQEMFISLQLGRFSGVSADILGQTISIELKKLIKSSAFVFEQMVVVAKQIIQVMMRHAALKNGEKYIKYTKILKCYVDVIQCDIMAFDFVNALANMKLVLSTIIEGLLEIIPDACIIAIGGSMTALKNYFSMLM